MNANNFLTELRNATAESHKKLDSTTLAKSIISENVSADIYYEYLHRFQPIVEYYESTIFPMITWITDLNCRRKSHLLNIDLKDRLKQFGVFHGFKNWCEGSLAGYMYVLEGSTLGGVVIAKHLRNTGIADSCTMNYLQAYGEETGIRWKSFTTMLCDFVDETQQHQQAIAGAVEAFDEIYLHMNR